MEFLVEFDVNVPEGTPKFEVENREKAESLAAARLVADGHLVRLWKRPGATGKTNPVGLYRADSESELDGLLGALPLHDWMHITVTPLGSHPNDPVAQVAAPSRQEPAERNELPSPRLNLVYRLGARIGQPLDLGDIAQGHRRIVPLIGGTFSGPELNGKLLPSGSADWQIVLSDGTALGDIRYTLQTDSGVLLYVQSRGVRYGSPDVLARLSRGEDVDASEYTFRTSTQIETASPELDWMNKGIFISVAGRKPGSVVYETYLVR